MVDQCSAYPAEERHAGPALQVLSVDGFPHLKIFVGQIAAALGGHHDYDIDIRWRSSTPPGLPRGAGIRTCANKPRGQAERSGRLRRWSRARRFTITRTMAHCTHA
jgi:hypothetical protein